MSFLPRAIYLDPIEDYLLRGEGFSGNTRESVLDGFSQLYSTEYDCLEIGARLKKSQIEWQSQNVS